jgi:hypothetical protein
LIFALAAVVVLLAQLQMPAEFHAVVAVFVWYGFFDVVT